MHSCRLYYQYDIDKLSACPLTVHALLHVPGDIRKNGPPCMNWSFVMERWCGWLLPAVKSRKLPYVSLALRQHQIAMLRDIELRYDLANILQPRKIQGNGLSTRETLYSDTDCELGA